MISKTRHIFNISEIFLFSVIGVMEVCISSGLIPHNENYVGFFRASRIPAVITDKQLQPVYATDLPLPADEKMLEEVKAAPCYDPASGLTISGMDIRGGYVFRGTDESGIRRLTVQLDSDTEGIAVRITHNGNQQQAMSQKETGGLHLLRCEIESAGGTMRVLSEPSGAVEINLPAVG